MAIRIEEENDEIVSDINMTPLIDIMLVLLILFMVTSSIALESGLDVDLPKISGETNNVEGSAVIISLNNDGELSVQGKTATMDTLQETVAKALREEKTSLVILEGDEKAKLGNAVQIMDLAKAAGARKFAIAAEAEN